MAVVQLKKDNFKELVGGSKPVLIDFYATWCGPCKMLSPIIDEIAGEKSGEIVVCRADVDEETELAAAFGVSVIPTLVVMKGGKVSRMATGYMPKNEVLALL